MAGFFLFSHPMVHYFDTDVADEYGITEAVLINHFQFWIRHNKHNDMHAHDGRTWTYNSTKAFREHFPYLTERMIVGAINRLVEAGVILKGNYNTSKYDRTLWYAFVDEEFWISRQAKPHFPKKGNQHAPEVKPIPDDPPDNNTDKGTDQSARKRAAEPKLAKSVPDTSWQRWVDAWFEFYQGRHNGTKPRFDGAQAAALKKLREHLITVATQTGAPPDDCGFYCWQFILQHWDHLDDWQRGQFDLTVVLKKINDILNRIKNAHTQGVTASGRSSESAARGKAIEEY